MILLDIKVFGILNMVGDYMNSTFGDDVLQDALVSDADVINLLSFVCANCNTKVFSKNKLELCPVCHGHLTEASDKSIDDYSHFIPFKINIDEAIRVYKKKVMFNPLIPFLFKSKRTIENIISAYVPGYLVGINVNGDVSFLAGDKVKSTDGKNFTTKKFNVKGYNNFDYRNILVSLWSKLDIAKFKDAFNYDYQQLEELNLENINEVIIDSDLNVEEVMNDLNTKVVNKSLSVIKKNIPHELKKITNNELKTNVIEYKKILIPVYYLNIRYKGKDYQYIMNGSCGKLSFSLTYGFVELIIFSMLIFLIIFGISFLLARIL